jgi:hypothetical protein
LETENLQRQKQQAELTKRVPELLQNPRTLAAELTKKGEEGSLLKALFYKSLGMTNLALEEEKKLGAGAKWQSAVSPDGTSQALIRYNADGLPIAGFDSSGNALEPQQLAQYAAGGLAGNIDIVGGTYVNDTTGEVGRVVTDKRTGRSMIQTGKGIIPLGAGWRPQSSAGSLADQRTRMLQELNLKLVGKTAEEAMAILRPYNQALAGQGLPIIQPSELNIQAPQIGNGAAPAAGPVAPPAAAPAAPAAATSVAPPPTTTPAATSVAPPVTTGAAPALTPTTPNLSPVAAPMAATAGPAAGGRPTMSQLQAQAAGAETEAKATAEDVAKAKMNAGKINEQVDTLNELSNQLLQHPGFSVSVGASAQPGFQFIPGTDKATFYSLFNQIKGQAFLSAIESLKGMGALSDREGAAATAAVTALSLDMNEKDFRKASHQLVSQMRRYADRNARKAGQPLPYNEPDLATQTRENRQAQTWLKSARVGGKNPDGTPITQQQIDGVRQRLWQRGEID